MALVRVTIKGGRTGSDTFDRVPVSGDYVLANRVLFRVLSVALIPQPNQYAAAILVERDADGRPDEANAFLSSHYDD